jgi:subtilisin family serine protease
VPVLLGALSCTGAASAAVVPAPPGVSEYLRRHGAVVSTVETAAVLPHGVPATDLEYEQGERSRIGQDGVLMHPLGRGAGFGVTIRPEGAGAAAGAYTCPVLTSPGNGLRVVPLPRVVFRLLPDTEFDRVGDMLAGYETTAPAQLRPGLYVVELREWPDRWESLRLATVLDRTDGIAWAAPDCAREFRKSYLPNDIADMWHLHNTNAPPRTNHCQFAGAWDTSFGTNLSVVAIIDDGIDMTHTDLVDNIWINPGEVPGDGLDNDGNGYIDDVNGWDFYKGTNVAAAVDQYENHGTFMAGLIAARGDNGTGICGAAPKCALLSAKVASNTTYVSDIQHAEAVAYASRHAQVVVASFSVGSSISNLLAMAYDDAATRSLVFAAAGNLADTGVYQINCEDPPYVVGIAWSYFAEDVEDDGLHVYRWTYSKDSSTSHPEDCGWIDRVTLPDGRTFDFEDGQVPPGWEVGGNADWHASPQAGDAMVVGSHSLRSGNVGDYQWSWAEVSAVGTGRVSFYYQCFGERGCFGDNVINFDRLDFSVDGVRLMHDANNHPAVHSWNFIPVDFPAALLSVVAVGATTEEGHHSPYSQYGTPMEICAPSSGSTTERRPRTTDRQGLLGLHEGDYYDSFGGTSASTAIAAGAAALLFAANPDLTPQQARQILRASARKVGTVPYDASGHNPLFGYGQVDAAAAMWCMLTNMPPRFVHMKHGGNALQFELIGVESGRVYEVMESTGGPSGSAWNWTSLTPTGISGRPVFGQETTPAIPINPAAGHKYYRIEK